MLCVLPIGEQSAEKAIKPGHRAESIPEPKEGASAATGCRAVMHGLGGDEHLGNPISSWKRAADGVVIFFPTTSSTFVSSSDTAFESPSSFLWHKSLQVPPEMPRFSFPSPSGPCPWLHAPSSTSSKPRRVLVGGHETAATTPHRGKSFATPYVIIYHRWIFHGGRKKKPALKQIVIIGDNCPL
ncbi:hypothetical protein Anapl_02328 [Anas platyrhynchos]|uniref:Uncharacterized protein n=1 Tax=Anas platyrhynchos TaxID=8839 RepID=R0L6F7_ANAPL|nr:hypothetical protein Anapl_02328 [Anas platyrhynchos]